MTSINRIGAQSLAAALVLSGCSVRSDDQGIASAPSDRDLQQALQTYFDKHHECAPFFELPAEVRIGQSSFRTSQLEAFADAGLLKRTGEVIKSHEVTGAPERHARYEATPLGNKSIQSGAGSLIGSKMLICYGKRQVEGVTSNGIDEFAPDRVSVKYKYRLVDVPSWTSAPSIKAFYPALAERLNGAPGSDSEELQRIDNVWALPKQTAFGLFDFRQEGH